MLQASVAEQTKEAPVLADEGFLPATTETRWAGGLHNYYLVVLLAGAKTNTVPPAEADTNTTPTRRSARTRVTAAMSDRVIAAYGAGSSTREISAHIGLSRTAVLRVLAGAGIERRPRGGHHRA